MIAADYSGISPQNPPRGPQVHPELGDRGILQGQRDPRENKGPPARPTAG